MRCIVHSYVLPQNATILAVLKCHYPHSVKEAIQVDSQIQNSLLIFQDLIFLDQKIDHNKTIIVLDDHNSATKQVLTGKKSPVYGQLGTVDHGTPLA